MTLQVAEPVSPAAAAEGEGGVLVRVELEGAAPVAPARVVTSGEALDLAGLRRIR